MEQAENKPEEKLQKKHEESVLLVISVICLILAGILSFNMLHRVHRRLFPISTESNVSLIQGWMSIRYISRTYGVPEEIFSQNLSIDLTTGRTLTLTAIAKKLHKNPAIFIKEVQTIILEFQSNQQLPTAS